MSSPAPLPRRLSHGTAFEAWWAANLQNLPPQPVVACASTEQARPGYSDINATELLDQPQVLDAKIAFLISMMKNAKEAVCYTGAGISHTAIPDYASRANGSIVKKAESSGNRKLLPPTYSHRVLAALFKKGLLKYHLDQNHDCFGLKAGIPLENCCFIHGHWFDTKNGVLMMDDKLRPDLLEQMLSWSQTADLCFVIGSSLSGMTADTVAEETAKRFQQQPQTQQQGTVILTLQETRLDNIASLKIYAKIEDVMQMLEKKLKLKIDSQTYPIPVFPPPVKKIVASTKK
jgi:NAD-dependent SIR2 family protein deacetylase